MDSFENNENQGFEPAEVIQPQQVEPQYQPAAPQYQPPAPQYQPTAQEVAWEQPQVNMVAEEPKQPAPKKGNAWKGIVSAVLVLALVAGSCGFVAWTLNSRFEERLAQQEAMWEEALSASKQNESNKTTVIQHGTTIVEVADQSPAQVYAENVDKVVLIKSQVQASGFSSGGLSTGSGFILSSDGYVVTNYHVVEGGTKLSVVIYDNQELAATLVGYDNANDVALLKVDAQNLPAVVLGDSDSLTVGSQVVAIGNPLGELTSTLTVGYVSAKDRTVNTEGSYQNMIQTDAAINSGNSGGPLFNMAGQVVGITTAKYSGSSASGATIEGIGFAIPINDVSKIIEDLATKGYISGAYLGVSVSDMDAEAADYYGMPMGAYVNEVVEGYCAAKAGLRAKDIITAVDDHVVESVNDLSRAIRNYEAGDTVVITIYRSGAQKTIEVTLDEKPQEDTQPAAEEEKLTPFPGIG